MYSYGVVLLELLTGRVPVDMKRPPGEGVLVPWVRLLGFLIHQVSCLFLILGEGCLISACPYKLFFYYLQLGFAAFD